MKGIRSKKKKETLQRKILLLKKVQKKKAQGLSFNKTSKPQQVKTARRIIKDIPQWKQPKREAMEPGTKNRACEAMKVLIKITRWNLN